MTRGAARTGDEPDGGQATGCSCSVDEDTCPVCPIEPCPSCGRLHENNQLCFECREKPWSLCWASRRAGVLHATLNGQTTLCKRRVVRTTPLVPGEAHLVECATCRAARPSAPVIHAVEDFSTDDEGGWWWACKCGITEGPFPDRTEALDALFDHQPSRAAARSES